MEGAPGDAATKSCPVKDKKKFYSVILNPKKFGARFRARSEGYKELQDPDDSDREGNQDSCNVVPEENPQTSHESQNVKTKSSPAKVKMTPVEKILKLSKDF